MEGPPDDGIDTFAAAEAMSSTVRPPKSRDTTRIVLVPYDPDWRNRFKVMGTRIRKALGDVAVRVDHEGSTAVPGLLSKPVIDIQISVAALEPVDAYVPLLEPLGLSFDPDNLDRTKRFLTGDFRGVGMANVHVREVGSFGEQFQLLFRDFLRAEPAAAARYADEKERLAANAWITVDEYAEAKGEVVWTLIREASRWAAHRGWEPGPSDC